MMTTYPEATLFLYISLHQAEMVSVSAVGHCHTASQTVQVLIVWGAPQNALKDALLNLDLRSHQV